MNTEHRARSSILHVLARMARLAQQAYPTGFAVLVLIELVQGFVPVITAWLMKTLFDILGARVANPESPAGSELLTILLVAQIALTVVMQSATPVSAYVGAELGRRLALRVQMTIFEKINSLVGIAPFENPKFHDIVRLAEQGAQVGPVQIARHFPSLLRSTVTLIGFLGVLISFSPFLAAGVALAVLPQLLWQLKTGRRRLNVAISNSPKERRAAYYGFVLSGVPFIKEMRLFDLAGHFLNLFRLTSEDIHAAQRRQQLSELRVRMLFEVAAGLLAGGAFVVVALQAFGGSLSVGDVVLYTSSVISVQSALAVVVFTTSSLNEAALFYRHFDDLLSIPQPLPLQSPARAVPPLTVGIELRNVSFRYGDSQPWVLRDVSLLIPARQCVAIVGLNGAGKSTLVKLLTRLYDVSEGQILWDGIDVREFDPVELRYHVACITQDFVRYELSANENIGVGNVARMHDSSAISQAAKLAGVSDTIEQLPQGYETILSRVLSPETDGRDLSGGEWQKIGLARMFMREADLRILDEPTAALDASAEYDLYQRFVETMSERTSLLISHRFSTVRKADLVAVLEDGRISEYGSHEELLIKNGSYARLYHLQAEQYQ